MYRHELLAAALAQRVIGIVRAPDAPAAHAQATRMIEAGLTCVEVTLTTRDGLAAVRQLRAEHGGVVVGAGTVLGAETAAAAVEAGAQFIVSPHLDPAVVRVAHRHGVPALPGAGSVTEIVHALETGADAVKLFPASAFGPGWLTQVRAALPQAPIVPTGGVAPADVPAWIDAGAVACGLGSALTAAGPDEAARSVQALVAGLTGA